MGRWQLLFEDWQTHRVMALETDSHIPPLENMTGLDSPQSGDISLVPLPPIYETEGDAPLMIELLIPTMTDPLNIKELVTKLP